MNLAQPPSQNKGRGEKKKKKKKTKNIWVAIDRRHRADGSRSVGTSADDDAAPGGHRERANDAWDRIHMRRKYSNSDNSDSNENNGTDNNNSI